MDEAKKPGHELRIALISMPWPLFQRPSIQLGSLKAFLRRTHPWLHVHALHPYLHLASLLGADLYHVISQNMWLAEAIYAPLLHPEVAEIARGLAEGICRKNRKLKKFDFLASVEMAKENITTLANAYDWTRIDLIGFSVCTNQLLSSLAAARSLKRKNPIAKIVLGGSACLPEMVPGLYQTGFVDYLIHGEGERPLAGLCAFLAKVNDALPCGVWDVQHNKKSTFRHNLKNQMADLDQLPFPDYDDYFREVKSTFPSPFIPTIPVEFSRGCWWGKCRFCNLNQQWKGYRSKSPMRMEEEIIHLAHRHGCLDFAFTDNSLPPRKGAALFEILAKKNRDFSFFSEVRASQRNIFPELREAGTRTIQVGIEALSQGLLARMRKGETVMDNVVAMKDALDQGIELQGNIIVDFPGTRTDEIEETLWVLDFLLPFPPLRTSSFFLGSGSDIDMHPENHGLYPLAVHKNVRKLFPKNIAGLFPLLVKDYRGDRAVQRRLWEPVRRKMETWKQFHQNRTVPALFRPALSFRDGGDFLLIRQEMPDGRILHHRLRGTSREIYLLCGEPRDLEAIAAAHPSFSVKEIKKFLDAQVDKLLVFRDVKTYLALAVRERHT